ncbi:zinc-ribbon domain-containing protein [Paracoccus fontiphilus]|uniref:Zinc-ribbon domain-containing protein n=1 Tax=Paracoccus fontiphilus TaxID=1815556 RepID=A0ABV7IDE8_9RHOB|nr:zinc-ribbon domain-containing protein [Paracoccus fontiphilus]
MAEIRLVCPGCAAEYRVPETAIPPEGREVECSGCGNVWVATAQPARTALAGFPALAPTEVPADLPRLSRRLPDTVLDILRDEVEHERRARAAETGTTPPAAGPAAPPRPVADPEWPATTITRHVDSRPAGTASTMPPPRPVAEAPARPPRQVAPEPVKPLPKSLPKPENPSAQEKQASPVERPSPSTPVQAPAVRRARAGYAAGFSLAALPAAACVALYLLAPILADRGAFGESLMQLRGQVDEARLWLQDRARP